MAISRTTRLGFSALLVPLACVLLGGCAHRASIVAESDLQWTGVAVAEDGRLFVNYPRWSDRYEMAVAEVGADGATAYPNVAWNQWEEGAGWLDHFVHVQSVHVGPRGRLWVLDTGRVDEAAGRHAVVYQIDLSSDHVAHTYVVPLDVAPEGSYLNDIRFEPSGRYAFISESGLGAIIVFDTESGTMRRVLADDPSTKGSADKTPTVGGRPWLVQETGEPNVVNCDGIAVSPDGQWVYYMAISNDQLHRVPVAALIDPEADIAAQVEDLGTAPVTDGMIFDDAGNLYFSALERNAIIYRMPEGKFRTLTKGPSIRWPDSFAIAPDGRTLIFSTAQIHLTPKFSADGSWPDQPFRIWSVPLAR